MLAEAVQQTSQRETLVRLIAEYEPALRRLAGAYAEQAVDREDIFQEIAVALWQAIPKFRGEASERTWLYRIAHNVAISWVAKFQRRGRNEKNIPEGFDPSSVTRSAEQEVLLAERIRLLNESIRNLALIDRQIILLHLEDLSYAEIEEVSGLSETAVASRLTRIREKLKEAVRDKEAGNE